jgi:hypothetical protein
MYLKMSLKDDQFIKDGSTIEQIYRSFERRKRQKKIKFKKQLKKELNLFT